jgi:hypothetical protein
MASHIPAPPPTAAAATTDAAASRIPAPPAAAAAASGAAAGPPGSMDPHTMAGNPFVVQHPSGAQGSQQAQHLPSPHKLSPAAATSAAPWRSPSYRAPGGAAFLRSGIWLWRRTCTCGWAADMSASVCCLMLGGRYAMPAPTCGCRPHAPCTCAGTFTSGGGSGMTGGGAGSYAASPGSQGSQSGQRPPENYTLHGGWRSCCDWPCFLLCCAWTGSAVAAGLWHVQLHQV